MRRRLPLTIIAVLALAVTVMLVVRGATWRDGADRETANRPDSVAQADGTARVEATSVEEPPCVASWLGLPCR